jgi:DNA-binding Lrp family transcriptional regulator
VLIERQSRILEIARQAGRVTVDDLAGRFDVSPQTIRKDLNELCDRRMLTRIHGGAILSSGVENVGYDARRMIASDEKEAIGRAAAERIPDQASLFINIGTTTEAVARALLQHQGLMVITNNLNVAGLMRVYPQIEVVMAGGVVRHTDGGVIGEAAVDFIRNRARAVHDLRGLPAAFERSAAARARRCRGRSSRSRSDRDDCTHDSDRFGPHHVPHAAPPLDRCGLPGARQAAARESRDGALT